MKGPYRTHGSAELCAWRSGPGVFTIQTRHPEFARKLRKRQDACEGGTIGINCYLRQFAVKGDWRKLRRLITRYLTSAGDQFFQVLTAQDRAKIIPRVKTAGASEGSDR